MTRSGNIIVTIIIVLLILIGTLLAIAIYTGARRGVADVKSGRVQATLLKKEITAPAAVVANVVTADDPTFGPANAKVTVVEFGDFQCPYCRQMYPIFRTLMVRYGDRVLFLWRDFPITDSHTYAQKAAEAGECAQEQNPASFWTLHDKIFVNQSRMDVPDLERYAVEVGLDGAKFSECLASGKYAAETEQDFRDGVAAGVRGTPTFFVNGVRVEGVVSMEQLEGLIVGALGKNESSTP